MIRTETDGVVCHNGGAGGVECETKRAQGTTPLSHTLT